MALQLVCGDVGKLTALAFGEQNVADDGLAAQAIRADRETIGRTVDVRIVDLERITGEDDFSALAATGDDRLHLVRGEVLRLVDDQVLVRQAATANVSQRLDLQLACVEQLFEAAHTAAFAAARDQQELQI